MGWVTDHWALTWVALALVLAAVEVATLDLVFIMLAGGALAGALAAGLGAPFWLQVVSAAAAAVLLLAAVRPFVLRRLRQGDPTLTGTAALVGRAALVLETVGEYNGRVRIGGEVWTARTTGGSTILPGQTVRVVSIEGATAVVAESAPRAETQ